MAEGKAVTARGRPVLIVFTRAPRLGAVKRRLAGAIGAPAALGFHRRTVAALLRRVVRDRRWQCRLAVTPARNPRRTGGWPRGLARLDQGTGDLGRRMARVMGRFGGPVVLVGGDIPDLGPGEIAAAFAALGRAEAVFGPARDGGYWLVGLRRGGRARGLFRGVRWSSAHALADTLANLAPSARVALLAPLEDVDDGPSFARYRARRP
jgi:uncharacterized protein